MIDFWRAVARQLGEHRKVFLAQVVANSRHSPGTAGARLALMEDGTVVGTIGGGVMERDVLAAGRRTLEGETRSSPQVQVHEPQVKTPQVKTPQVHEPQVKTLQLQTLRHRRPRSGEDASAPGPGGASALPSGMICAGEQTNLYAVLDATDRPWVTTLIDHLERDTPGALVVDPQGFVVESTSGPGEDPLHHLDVSAGGTFRYRQDLLVRHRMVLFGGGHCALALARTMTGLGYRVEVWEAATKEPEPDLRQHVARLHRVTDFSEAAGQVRWPELSWAVVMTSDFPSDVAALEGALRRPFPFLGVMGSPAKLTAIRRRLLDEGFDATDLARLIAPVGLALGSHTPEEIAISVAAQILALRNGLGDKV